jgi:hypothetical protein
MEDNAITDIRITYRIQFSERKRGMPVYGMPKVWSDIPHIEIYTEEAAIVALKRLDEGIAFHDCDLRILKVTTEVIERQCKQS